LPGLNGGGAASIYSAVSDILFILLLIFSQGKIPN